FVNMSASIGFAHGPSDELVIPQTTVAPNIDGKLDDALWNAFEHVEWGLLDTGGKVDPNQFSRSWAAYDDKFLYVAFENLEPNTGAITTISPGHDVDVWRDDENELFIEPNHLGDRPYFHIMINAENTTQDDENGGAEGDWDPDLESATRINNDNWVLELKIPFEDLGFDNAPVGETWGWNFNRHIMAGVDIWTGWTFVGASFHTPDQFGNLIFGIEKAAVDPTGKLARTWGSVKDAQ
ncbi:sugar-binding protein, partial [Candidatus Poribacteria bacterium]